jgi:ketosteroid isomerase-like protein
MAVSTERLEEVGRVFSKLWDERDLEAVRAMYREDAVFISPNPPGISSEFGTTLEGRDEILRYYEACLKVVPTGAVTTVALLTGIDMAVWVWQAGPVGKGADIIMFDDDGLIVRQRVTAPQPD